MGAVILSTGTCTDKSISSSIAHSVIAGKQALQKAAVAAEDVDLVINVGVYRDKNMVEPAMAALIQKELGMNPDYIKAGTGKNAFSLDLMNGGIGALNAMQVGNSFLQSGAARYVLIVGADSHPSNKENKDFPYKTVGSAFLLGKGKDDKRGFQNFHFDTEIKKDFGRVGKIALPSMGTRGREIMQIQSSSDYVSSLLDFSGRKARDFMARHSIKASDTLFVSSELDAEFSDNLGKTLGFANTAGPALFKQYGDTNSSTFGLGYHQLQTQSKLKPGASLLFVGATSGLTVGCVHYVY